MDKLNPITILVTGAGAPGIKGTLYSLRNNYDKRKITIVGVDMQNNVVGAFLCDKFHVIPPAKKVKDYLTALIKICKEENVNILLPQNTLELEILSRNYLKFEFIGTKVVTSSETSIKLANDKFQLMKVCKEIGVSVGEFYKVDNYSDLVSKAKLLGWPSNKVVVKPPISNGMRGVRIISETLDLKKMFYDEKPNSLFTTMKGLYEVLGDTFPDLLVTEYLPGKEYTVDVFRHNKKTTVIPRSRDQIRSGITFSGEVIKHEKLIESCKKISDKLDLENCYGFQFKLDVNDFPKILESNPRVQGTMVLATIANANIVYSSVKNVLGEEIPDFNIKWGTKISRFWGGVGVDSNNKITII